MENADRLESTVHSTINLHLGKAEMLRDLRNFLNKEKPEPHSIDHLNLKGRGVEKSNR